ncbi:hypothetical protein K2173_012607 [Erythroxylum novogranatense]|uniref:Endonuclease/exonuclease/phosphatase domain-containing protein n=1 Tax=Erythroxylum novogranatense TaxID=1862640 RepID=A0AAV8S7H2_9ROSI|nr:hypothetical protein K2173_012607 [Erythroxylum novogranatense]
MSAVERMAKILHFSDSFAISSDGRAGGIALFWHSNSCKLDIISSTAQCIHARCDINLVPQIISFVYVRPYTQWKDLFWTNLVEFSHTPWTVIGDFNDYAAFDDSRSVHSGSVDSLNRIMLFRRRWAACELIDAGMSGCRFTWFRRVGGRIVNQAKLDRVLWNTAALTQNSHAKYRPLRFEAAWLTHPTFEPLFASAWAKGRGFLPQAIRAVTTAVSVWKSEVFGNIHKQKSLLLARIRGIQCNDAYGSSAFLQQLEVCLQAEYHQILVQQELLWCRNPD